MTDKTLTMAFARWGVLVGAGLIAIAAAPYVAETTEHRAKSTELKLEARRHTQQLQIQDEARAGLSEIARARIEDGCTQLILNGEPVLIRPGMRARDGVTGHPMAPNIVVCDYVGNTAVTDPTGHLTDFAALNAKSQKTEEQIDIELEETEV